MIKNKQQLSAEREKDLPKIKKAQQVQKLIESTCTWVDATEKYGVPTRVLKPKKNETK